MDQQTFAVVIDNGLILACALAGGLVISYAYGYAVGPAKRVSWIPPVVILLAVSTALVISVITVIKGSIALSLGLIGAMSVARFRTPVSDPRQLALVLVAIAMGVGFGAGQLILTGLGTIFIAIIVAILYSPAFWEAHEPTHPRIVVRLSFAGDNLVTAGPISEYFHKWKIRHTIKGTTHKSGHTSITVHIFDCPVIKADQLVRDLANVYPDSQFESDLQIKPGGSGGTATKPGTDPQQTSHRQAASGWRLTKPASWL